MVVLTSAVVARAVIVSVAHHAPALVGVADTATGAVVIDVAHHAPAVVCVADIIATATFIVRGTGGEAEVAVAGAIAAPTTALIIRGAVSGWSVSLSTWTSLVHLVQ